MKKNIEGFVLIEILTVTVVVMTIFAILYSNYVPLTGELEKRQVYSDTEAQYLTYYIRKFYQDEDLGDLYTDKYRILYDSSDVTPVCELLVGDEKTNCEALAVSAGIEKIIATRYNITDLKENDTLLNSPDLVDLKEYITSLPKYIKDSQPMEVYRIILKTKEGYSTSQLIVAGDTIVGLENGKEYTFEYTGDTQMFTVPGNGTYKVELWGASGGYYGNNAAYTSGEIDLLKDDILYFNVGQSGVIRNSTCLGGYNGGGSSIPVGIFCGSTGGGATDVSVSSSAVAKYRYIKDYINGSSINDSNHWVEIKVYDKEGILISQGKTVTSSVAPSDTRPLSRVTDGDLTTSNYTDLGSGGPHWVEVDLGAEYEIGRVVVWHYYGDSRTYYDSKTELYSEDRNFVTTIYDSDYSGEYVEIDLGHGLAVPKRYNMNDRIMVAGAGGGSGIDLASGQAGGLIAYNGETGTYPEYQGLKASQTVGGDIPTIHECTSSIGTVGIFGAGGLGGANQLSTTTGGGGGGGSGYYGGSGSSGLCNGGWSGGGGSSYISGHTGCVAVTSSSVPKTGCLTGTTDNSCSIHYSNYIFENTKMIDGKGYSWSNVIGPLEAMPKPDGTFYSSGVGHEGNGYAKITFID